jgi:hypothetical protein
MTYADLVARLGAFLGDDHSTDSDWTAALPQIIETAELRIYRDLDLLATRKTLTVTLASGVGAFAAPSDWLLGQGIRLTASNATLERRDVTFLNEYGGNGNPRYWAEPTQGTIQVAPVPVAGLDAELSYRYRPAALGPGNQSTWMSTNVPDLLFAACMAASTGYLRNYGAQADDPKMAMSWEQAYQTALATARLEEARRKGESAFDSSAAPPISSNAPSR